MQKKNLESVLSRKITRHTQQDLQEIFKVLNQDYEQVLDRHCFDTMFVEKDKFDFAQGYLCGTVKNVGGHCVLLDLSLREIHLF